MADSETLIDYLAREMRGFDQLPFNPVDSLVLSSLSYCNFEYGPLGSADHGTRFSLAKAVQGVPFETLVGGSWLCDQDESLSRFFLLNLLLSPRYAGIEMAFYAHETLEKVEKQFSAVTFFLPDNVAYLAFRGTDGTLAGWKEDFNISFMHVVPSQSEAVRYLSGVASSCDCDLMVGGHSKGGNLAEYSALVVHQDVYERIVGVYNHDGPAFMEDPAPRIDEPRFQNLLHKTVPESSVFGMILERRADYRIIESNAFSFMQHAPFSWLVDGSDFVYRTELNAGATYFDESLNDWLLRFTPEQRGRFIDTMYDLVCECENDDAVHFSDKLPQNLLTMAQASTKLDADTRHFIVEVFSAAAGALKDEAFKRVKNLPMLLPRPEVKPLADKIAASVDIDPFDNAEAAR